MAGWHCMAYFLFLEKKWLKMKYKSKNIFVLVYICYGTTLQFLSLSVFASTVTPMKQSPTGKVAPSSQTVTQKIYTTFTPTVTNLKRVSLSSVDLFSTTLVVEPTKSTTLVVSSTPVDKGNATVCFSSTYFHVIEKE